MWPWESTPQSVASGILDDETYDWLLLCRAMLETGGVPLVADEATLRAAHALAKAHTGRPVCATGASGVAGLLELTRAGAFGEADHVGIVLSGHER
jgi:hypothetical protein